MAIVIDGKKIANEIKLELKSECDKLKENGITPCLAVILVGEDPASKVYVKNKSKACEEVGINFEEYILNENISQKELMDLISRLNENAGIDGILLQSPIPKHLSILEAFSLIEKSKDVDGFNPLNVGYLTLGFPTFIPCTPLGVMTLLDRYKIDIEGKNCAIIGRSNIVGKPIAQLLSNKNATVTICHSKTKDLKSILLNSDIIISAAGKINLVTADMVKKDSILIDVGINRNENGKLSGDIDFENVKDIAQYITPVPGGVGPMTVAMLMNNVILACKNRSVDKNGKI